MNDKEDSPKTSLERLLGQDADRGGQRRDPSFSHFVDSHDDGYEEPDRDTDFDAGYQTDSVEEDEEFDDALADEEHEHSLAAQPSAVRYSSEPDEEEEEDEDEDDDPDDWLDQDRTDVAEPAETQHWPVSLIVVAIVALVLLAAGGYGVMQQRAATDAELQKLRAALATSATPEEVRSSRGALQELQRAYDKLLADAEAMTLENRRLSDTVAGLEAQLGVQQSALSKGAAKPVATPAGNSGAATTQPSADRFAPLQSTPGTAKPAPKPVQTPPPSDATPAAATPVQATPSPATPSPATPAKALATPAAAATPPAEKSPAVASSASAASGPWFVNFGSYATRSMAESWAAKLQPGAGKVIIAANDSAGKTLYRLRVVGLADRDTAKAVAHKLETDQGVAQLWVGRE